MPACVARNGRRPGTSILFGSVTITMNFLSRFQSPLLSVLRIVTAYLFIWHGTAKVFGFPASMGDISGNPLMIAAAALELIGGTLLLLGLFTRPVAFILSGQMAFAYFLAHASEGNPLLPLTNSGESAVLFCFVFLYIAAAGAGSLSIDHVRGKH